MWLAGVLNAEDEQGTRALCADSFAAQIDECSSATQADARRVRMRDDENAAQSDVHDFRIQKTPRTGS